MLLTTKGVSALRAACNRPHRSMLLPNISSILARSVKVSTMSDQAAALAPQTPQTTAGRSPAVPLFKGKTVADGVKEGLEALQADPNHFILILRQQKQAEYAMRLLQELAEVQQQSGQTLEMRVFNLRRSAEQQQPAPGQGYTFRHLLRCTAAEPRTPAPETKIMVAGKANHGDVTRRAFDALKIEALKPDAVPSVTLSCIGMASYLQAFKALNYLRFLLRGIRRSPVVQLYTQRATRKTEDNEVEVKGLHLQIFLEDLPAVTNVQQAEQQ